MKCPYCTNSETKVIDKRDTETGAIKRRRECLKCEKRFTTFEKVEDITLIIIKKDGKREQFDKQKLERGLIKACEKRPVPYDKIRDVVEKIEAELRKKKNVEIPSTVIGNAVMRRLKSLDKVAYIRFASVYREFEDIDSFEKELHNLKN